MPDNWLSLKHLFNFSWRASRREYFLLVVLGWTAIIAPIFLVGSLADFRGGESASPNPMLLPVFVLWSALQIAVLIAMLAAAIRRMHDQDKSGLMLLLIFVPFIGWIFHLVFLFTPGDYEENRFGPNPRYAIEPDNSDLVSTFE